jgi:hypothetical protein
MIDLLALEWQITEKADKGIHVAPIVRELIAELKEARKERAAVVAWLRAECGSPGHEDRFCAYCNVRRNIAADIESGEHCREDGK